MANLENNHDKESSKSVTENVKDRVKETARQAQELAADAATKPVETAKEFGKQAVKDVTDKKWWAKLLLILFWSLLGLVAVVLIAINLNVTKRWAAQKALNIVNQNFKAEMSTESVTVDYFGDVTVKGLRIKDYKGLEFIKAREFRAKSDWFSLAANAISGKDNSLSFNALSLIDADIKVITYKGDSISNFVRYTKLFDNGTKRDPNKPPFQLNARIDLMNSRVSIVNRNHEGDAGKWLDAVHVNLHAPSVKVNGKDVFAQINNMSFTTTRWGKQHIIDTFSTELAMTDQFLSLKDLTLNTDHSLLQGNIKFHLNNGSWAYFADKVRWDMALKPGSQVSGYDISYFVTNWENYKPVNISGRMTGPMNRFYLENFMVANPDVNINTKTLKVSNLLKGNFQIETNQLSTDFTYKGLKAMLPGFIALKMKNFADGFGRLKFNGAVLVNPKRVLIPKGSLMSGIGQAKLADFYLDNYSTPNPLFRGVADLHNFNVAAITRNRSVGLITGRINVNGESFNVNTMKLRAKANIASIDLMGREINNLVLDGFLNRKTYSGVISVNDEKAKAIVDGLIDFRTSTIAADLKRANIQYLDLNYFGVKGAKSTFSGSYVGKLAYAGSAKSITAYGTFTNADFIMGDRRFTGNLDVDMNFRDLNNMTLNSDLRNVVIYSGGKKISLPSGNIRTYFEGGQRIVSVDAPGMVRGRIAGKFNLADLGGMLQNAMAKILVGPAPKKQYRGQSFDMNFTISQPFIALFAKDLYLPHGARVAGSFNGNTSDMVLNADAEQLKYVMTKAAAVTDADRALANANPAYKINRRTNVTRDSAMADSLQIRINTASLTEQLSIKLKRAEYNKNLLKDLALTGRRENSVLHLSADFLYGTPEEEIDGKMKQYAVNINQTTDKAGDYVFRFEPTAVKFNDVEWNIDTSAELNHSITYRRKSKDFVVKNLRIYSDASELLVKNAEFKDAKDFGVDAEVKNLEISKILALTKSEKSMDIKGTANGTIKFRMDKNSMQPLVDLTVNDILMNGKQMGNVLLQAKNSGTPNVFTVSGTVSSGIFGSSSLDLSGTINNNTAKPTLNLDADMKEFDLAFAGEFVKSVFTNFRGKATGKLKISGTMADMDYSGDIALKGFGLKLNFTGADYSMDDTVIQLSRGLAILNNIGIHDGRSNSSGTISGSIQFETLASMGVNLIMRANNLMLLNTTQKDNDLFWGRVYGQGDIFVDGPVSGLSISTPNMRALNNSTFTFNSNSTSTVEEYKMLRFLKEDQAGVVTVEQKKRSGANMNVDFNLSLDRGTTVNVLVGDDVGDISVRGVADNLRFHMARQGGITINGSYLVDNGTFVSKAILNRTFQITRGSSIVWDGDAMTPALDISANYLRTVSNAGEYLGMSLQPINVVLTTKITQTLSNPKIELGVSAPDVSSQIKETLASKLSQDEEKVIQFGSILVLNSFNVPNSGGLEINVGSMAATSGYNMLFKQLGSVLSSISNEFQVDLNYIKGDQASNTGDRANAGLSFTLTPRVTLKTGLGIPLSKLENTTQSYLSGEGIIEYDFSKKNDGTRIFRAYSKPSNIGLSASGNPNANQSYGAGVVYTRSFNTIFKRKKKVKADSTAVSGKTDTNAKK